MNVSDFDYVLPDELIAQRPTEKRDESRLLVVHRENHRIEHRRFRDILEYLVPGDCLVLNDSKVIPARLYGRKEGSGAAIEFLLSRRMEGDVWETLIRPGKRMREGDRVLFGDETELIATVRSGGSEGTRVVEFEYAGDFMQHLDVLGCMPLPPYIARKTTPQDALRYQTVYCAHDGSVAAPTAGLHFTPELLAAVREKGIRTAMVTLHVGLGTFRPVKCEQVEQHVMHFEEYVVSQEAACTVNETKQAGGRIIAVGTTACRTLESASNEAGTVVPGSGRTGIFIYPGYRFKTVDALLTNFHLPKSTLLMLVSALYDRDKMLDVYRTAVLERYRFFSYGDAMLIL